MRCPKCHYLGFDSGDRCRNCGYDFSLTAEDHPPPDLPIRRDDEPMGPLADLSLSDPGMSVALPGGRSASSVAPEPASSVDASDTDLPLFLEDGSLADSRAPIRPPAPRPPLAVRRATPEVPRPRARVTPAQASEPTLQLEPAETEPDVEKSDREDGRSRDGSSVAPSGRRVAAAVIDVMLLAAVDLVVVYLTLQLCGLTMADLAVLPIPPLTGFFLLLAGGYVVSFTVAGGQTIGKMALGIRVIGADGNAVRASVAMLRAAAYVVSVLPFGVGLVAGLFDRQRRALHDRLAETRVVKVS